MSVLPSNLEWSGSTLNDATKANPVQKQGTLEKLLYDYRRLCCKEKTNPHILRSASPHLPVLEAVEVVYCQRRSVCLVVKASDGGIEGTEALDLSPTLSNDLIQVQTNHRPPHNHSWNKQWENYELTA